VSLNTITDITLAPVPATEFVVPPGYVRLRVAGSIEQ
jgi:hypothetical protein